MRVYHRCFLTLVCVCVGGVGSGVCFSLFMVSACFWRGRLCFGRGRDRGSVDRIGVHSTFVYIYVGLRTLMIWVNCLFSFNMSFLLRKVEDVMTISKSQSLTSVSIKDCTLRVPNYYIISFTSNNKSNLHMRSWRIWRFRSVSSYRSKTPKPRQPNTVCLWMRVLICFCFLTHMCICATSKVHCESALGPGASGISYYCAPRVCVPDIIAGFFFFDILSWLWCLSCSSWFWVWFVMPPYKRKKERKKG